MKIRFLALVILLCSRAALADGSLSVGAVLTSSGGLGYESPYPGATVRGDYSNDAFVSRAEASYLWAKKSETGDGNGQAASALAGVRWRALDLMAGASYSRQTTSAWEKDQTRRVAELGWSHKRFRAAATYAGSDEAERFESIGVRLEGGNRLRIVGTFERIHFTSYFGEQYSGDKVTLAYFWRFSKGS